MLRRRALILVLALSTPAPAAADSSVRLRSSGGYLLVPVTLNGSGPFEFLLDTGATASLVDDGLARNLGLTQGRRESLRSLSGESGAHRVVVEAFRVGSVSVSVSLLAGDLGEVKKLGPIRGVLGSDVLGRGPFLLSLSRERLELDDDGALAARVQGEKLALRSLNGRRLVEAELEGASRPLLLVPDSGAVRVVLFERTSGIFGGGVERSRATARAGFVNGARALAEGWVRTLRIGPEVLHGVPTLFITDPLSLEGRVEDGLLPTRLFRDVWFDYQEGFVILNPRLKEVGSLGCGGAADRQGRGTPGDAFSFV